MSSPLVDWGKSLESKFESAVSKIPTPGYRPSKQEADPGMVKDAMQTYVDADARRRKASADPKLGMKKKAKPAKKKTQTAAKKG